MPQAQRNASRRIDGRLVAKIIFWSVVVQAIIMLSSGLVRWIAAYVDGLGLVGRVSLAVALGVLLFRTFYHPTARGVEAHIDRSARLPIQDTEFVRKVVAYLLGISLPTLSFVVASVLGTFSAHQSLTTATTAVVVAWTLAWLAMLRGIRVLGIVLCRYPEDDAIRDLKRGKPYELEALEDLIEDLALEIDPDVIRVREQRFKRLIDYIEEKKLDPEAQKRQTLLETTLADVRKRREEAELRAGMAEDDFHRARWRYKSDRLYRRKGRARRRDDIEDELRDLAGGKRASQSDDFDELGGAADE